jgi:hypothetical protein
MNKRKYAPRKKHAPPNYDVYPWLPLSIACDMFGMTYNSARNAVLQERFPVMTYRLGRYIVVDKDVMQNYFREQRERGLKKLQEPPREDRRKGHSGRRKKSAAAANA